MLDMRGQLEAFEDQFGSAGRALSRLIRPSIAAPKGRTLIWSDWSSIEARVLPWLADSRKARAVLDVFSGVDADPSLPDVYQLEAANIFTKQATEIDKAERQTGKVATLSLGFGGAVGALMAMAAGYGISLTEAEAKHIVDMWRRNNPWARRFWDELWEAFIAAMGNSGVVHEAGRVAYMYDADYMDGTMFAFLPDGRPLTYPRLRWAKRTTEDKQGNETTRTVLTYRRGKETRTLWYGVLAENATQAVAGSLLRNALVECERLMPDFVVGHTHDEIIGECDDNEIDAVQAAGVLEKIMTTNLEWAEGLPLAADTTTSWYYSKAVD